jgi:hypothetical protein
MQKYVSAKSSATFGKAGHPWSIMPSVPQHLLICGINYKPARQCKGSNIKHESSLYANKLISISMIPEDVHNLSILWRGAKKPDYMTSIATQRLQ